MRQPAARCLLAEPKLHSSNREALLRLSYRLSSVQCLYEKLVRTVQLRFYRSDRDPELCCNLLMLKALDVVKHECRSRAFRQPRDRSLEIDPQLRRITRCKRADLTRVLHRKDSRDATLVASRVFKHRIHGSLCSHDEK